MWTSLANLPNITTDAFFAIDDPMPFFVRLKHFIQDMIKR